MLSGSKRWPERNVQGSLAKSFLGNRNLETQECWFNHGPDNSGGRRVVLRTHENREKKKEKQKEDESYQRGSLLGYLAGKAGS